MLRPFLLFIAFAAATLTLVSGAPVRIVPSSSMLLLSSSSIFTRSYQMIAQKQTIILHRIIRRDLKFIQVKATVTEPDIEPSGRLTLL
jgi:hypothetical protein